MKLVGFLPLFLSSVAAFTTPATTARGGSIAKTTSTSTLASSAVTASPPVADEETWYEAIQLANRRKTDIGECERLAAQLESVGDCEFESKDSDTCATEIADRLELAKILRLKVELQQRLDQLQTSNLFVKDVLKEHKAVERKRFKEALQSSNSNVSEVGSDLGLW